jgi:hypothetical protein
MAPDRLPAGTESRLLAEFRADWADQMRALELEVQRVSSSFAVKGLGRSGALLSEYGHLFEQALEQARTILVRRGISLLEYSELGVSPANLARIRFVIATELSTLASSFEERLARSAQSMGFTSCLGITVLPKLKSLLTTLDSELEGYARRSPHADRSEAFRNLELKPNFFGVGLNLNRILGRVRDWWRMRSRRPGA